MNENIIEFRNVSIDNLAKRCGRTAKGAINKSSASAAKNCYLTLNWTPTAFYLPIRTNCLAV